MANAAKPVTTPTGFGRLPRIVVAAALSCVVPTFLQAQEIGAIRALPVSDMHYVDAQLRPFPAAADGTTIESNLLVSRYEEKVRRYRDRWSGLPDVVIPPGATLDEGDTGPRVAVLRKRLGLSRGDVFDGLVSDAMRAFRRDHGLPESDELDRAALTILNRPTSETLDLLERNLERARMLPQDLPPRFVFVDTASQQLTMFEGGVAVDSMKVVVGAKDRPTPSMAALIRYAEVDPYWHIPADLVREDFAPRVLRRGQAYLRRAGYEPVQVDGQSLKVIPASQINWRAVADGREHVKMRQRPGPGNAMGRVKFMFPNQLGIYLHDTPQQDLMENDLRLYSAGCVRLEDAGRLGEWLFGRDILRNAGTPGSRVELAEPVPVFITYFTAWPTDTGWTFRDDVYNRDATLPEGPLAAS